MSSITRAPRDHTSLAEVAPVCSTTSGAIQYGEPTTDESIGPPTRVDTPKSARRTAPNLSRRMLLA